MYLKPPINVTHFEAQNELHEIVLSDRSSSEESETKMDNEYLMENRRKDTKTHFGPVKNKLTPAFTDRTTPQKTRSKSKTHSGGSNQRSWTSRLSKDASLTKPSSSRTQTSVQDITSTYKKSKRDPQSLSKIESHLSGVKAKLNSDNSSDLKMEERLREFKILKESFLKSVFSKTKEEPLKNPPKNGSHTVKFVNSSFEERSTAAKRDESPPKSKLK